MLNKKPYRQAYTEKINYLPPNAIQTISEPNYIPASVAVTE